MRKLTWLAIMSTVVAAPAHAQNTWIVDAAFGPGAHFTDIQSAINASTPGDRVIVRSGTYDNFISDKGVAIIGQGQPRVRGGEIPLIVPPNQCGAINLPAGQTFSIQGVQIVEATLSGPIPAFSGLTFQNCLGRVIVQNVSTNLPLRFVGGWQATSLAVSSCSEVFVSKCRFDNDVNLFSSQVSLVDCNVHGNDGFYSGVGPGLVILAEPAVFGSNTDLTICGGTYSGGDGVAGGPFVPTIPGWPALRMGFSGPSRITIANGRGTSIMAGAMASSSMNLTGGTLHIEPSVNITGPGIMGSAVVTIGPLPNVHASQLVGLIVDTYAPLGYQTQLFMSPLASPISLGNLGTLWLDPAQMIFLGAFTIPATGTVQFRANVPSGLIGLGLRFQAIWAGGGDIALSLPSTIVLNS